MFFSKKILYQYFVVFCSAWDNVGLLGTAPLKKSHSFVLELSLHSTKNLKEM